MTSSNTRSTPPPACRRRRLPLLAVPAPVGLGRHFTRQALADWGWAAPDTRTDDVLLVVSELLANACLHGDGPRELTLTASTRGLRVEVSDCAATLPSPRAPGPAGAPGGHGLHIVERLSRRWGALSREGGKTVWAEVAATRPHTRAVATTAAGRCHPTAP